MTELERARAHLLDAQILLSHSRRDPQLRSAPRAMRLVENGFLAALSWVWECQERERLSDFVDIEIDWRATPVARRPGCFFVQVSPREKVSEARP